MRKIAVFITFIHLITFLNPIFSEEEVHWFYWQDEYNALKNKIQELESKLNTCTTDLKKCHDDSEDLKSQIVNLRQVGGETTSTLQKKMEEYEKKIQELTEKNKSLTEKEKLIIAKCKKILNKFRQKIKDLRKENQSLKEKEILLTSEINTLRNINEEQKKLIEKMENQFKELESKLEKEIQAGLIRLKKSRTRLTINLDEKISFSSGSTVLKSSAKEPLDKITEILSKYPENLIYVEGHTDNIPMRSFRIKDNWQLSTERALSVLRYILKKNIIAPQKISAAGYGEYKPIAPNDTPENRSLNRRVDLVVTIP